MISKLKMETHTMQNYYYFITQMLKRKKPVAVVALVASLILTQIISSESLINEQHSSEQQSPTTRTQQNNGQCSKQWIYFGNKCYKIMHSPRNYELAKGRCHDLTAQLAVIEDASSSREKESSGSGAGGGGGANIISFLSSPRNSEPQVQNKRYYVALSSDLLNQHQERIQSGVYQDNPSGDSYDVHSDSELAISDLWLPRDDPSFTNVTDKLDINSTVVLAYSTHYLKWGLLPVSPTKKNSFICERQPLMSQTISASNAPAQHQILEPKRVYDLSSQASVESPKHHSFSSDHQQAGDRSSSSSTQIDSRRQQDRDSAVAAPQPEPSNMLFREFPQDQSIVLGSTAEMRCSALENESGLVWTFNGKNLTSSNRVKLHSNGMLRLEHVRNTDDGNYTCTIYSGGISESKSARLEIIEKPHQPEYITAELLDRLSTSVRVKWTPGFNGNSAITKYLVEMRTVTSDNIDNEMNTVMQSSSWDVAKANISADQTSVIIPDLKPAKKYIFRIKATNRVGVGDPSLPTKPPIEVPVQPPSMPPENLSGSPKSSTSIGIQWSPPPVDSHNGLLKGYKIRHKLAGYASDSDWYTNDVLDAAHLNFVLDDLIVWQNYEIQVAAENDKGVGPFSGSIYVRTKEGKPDKGPRHVTAEAINSTSVKINWNPPPPQHINGLNQGYKIQAWYDMNRAELAKELNVPHNAASPLHSIVIDGLLPYTEYYLSVKCYTNAGDGPPNEDDVLVKTKQDRPEAVSMLEFADVLDKNLRVVWKPPKRINGVLDQYTLEYSESSSTDKKILKKYSAETTEARIGDLTPQTSYTFKIYAHTNVGQGPGRVNHTMTSVPPVLPEPPTNLIYSNVGPYSVMIQFNSGFDGNASIEKWIVEALIPTRAGDHAPRWHNIYVSTNHSQGNYVIVRNLRPFTRYRLRLTPVNIVGPSRYASEPTTEFQTAQVEPEQPPRDLSIENVKTNSVVARWSPLANSLWLGNPKGYNLTWSESNNSTIMYYLINDTRAESCIVRDLEEFTEYLFRIYAVNEAGLSPGSEIVSATTLEDVPSSGPTNLTAHALSPSTISVDWNSIPRRHRNGIVKGYKIQYQASKNDAPLQHKAVEDNSTKHVTLTDLKAYTTYHIAVAGYTATGDGVYSPLLNVQTLEDTPAAPQNLSVPQVSQTSARILWDPPEDPNGDILGYKVSYHALVEGSKETAQELHHTDRHFKVTNLKPDTNYVFTVNAKTKKGWGQQANLWVYTHDSELRANLPFFRESWFVILCASLSIVITIIITALLFVQTKSYKYKQDAIKSTSQDRLGDAGFTLDDDPGAHYNNGFGLLSHNAHHRRSNGALSQSTANFTLPKTPPRPHPGSVVYSDEGDDDVFDDNVTKPVKSIAGTSNYDSSGDSLTEKPSEISSSTAPESESADDEYVNMADRHFVNHYANVNGTLRGQKSCKKNVKQYSSNRTKPKLPQRPVPSVPKVPGDPSSSGSDNAVHPVPSTSGASQLASGSGSTNQNTQHADLLNSNMINLNGGRIIVDNMAGSRAPLPGFTSFV